MARPKGSKTNSKDDKAAVSDKRHNGGPPILNDNQRQTLAVQHLKKYESTLATKKAADKSFKDVCKIAKAELGDDAVDVIKQMILARTPEGEAELVARIERTMRAARWMAAPLGAQGALFEADRQPATERAFEEGKLARLEGKALASPYDPSVPQHQSWMEGYHLGSTLLADAEKRDETALFDAQEKGEIGSIGDNAPTYETAE